MAVGLSRGPLYAIEPQHTPQAIPQSAASLSVVVGRADVTDVFVRGKPLELNAVSRENVARFEVK